MRSTSRSFKFVWVDGWGPSGSLYHGPSILGACKRSTLVLQVVGMLCLWAIWMHPTIFVHAHLSTCQPVQDMRACMHASLCKPSWPVASAVHARPSCPVKRLWVKGMLR